MGDDGGHDGKVQKFNASKEIAQQRDVKLMLAHVNAITQARTGQTPNKSLYEMGNNEKVLNKVRGLMLTISAQKDLILMSRGLVKIKALNSWKRKYKKQDRGENKFEDDNNDYKTLMDISEKLCACELDINEADKTRSVDDDFMKVKDTPEGKVFEITENHREMLLELEDSYEGIEIIMYANEVISAGIEVDEEKTLMELEEEFLHRGEEA